MKHTRWRLFFAIVMAVPLAAGPASAGDLLGPRQVSRTSSGLPADGDSQRNDISGDGSIVVFDSTSSNLVVGDNNSTTDVFIYETATGALSRLNVVVSGVEPDGPSISPTISADGRFIAFVSSATNIASGAVGWEFYRFDRVLGMVDLVSRDLTGQDSNGSRGVVPSISSDGRFVAFQSNATDLVASDQNDSDDIFVRDMTTGTTIRANVDPAGNEANGSGQRPSLSGDGRYVAFDSWATNLTPLTQSQSGNHVFRKDLQAGPIDLVSITPPGLPGNGASGNASISADGARVAFDSLASDLVSDDDNGGTVDVFLRDFAAGSTTLVSHLSNESFFSGAGHASISGNGKFVAFTASADPASHLAVTVQGGVFVVEVQTFNTRFVSKGPAGTPPVGISSYPQLSSSGDKISFTSSANNLAVPDLNRGRDVFFSCLSSCE